MKLYFKRKYRTFYYTLSYSKFKYGLTVHVQAGIINLNQIQSSKIQLLKVPLSQKLRYSVDKLNDKYDLMFKIVKQENFHLLFEYLVNI